MTDSNLPWSEQYRTAAEDWADAESAAQLLEDMKSVVMAQRQAQMGDIPVNRAEQAVKASKGWEDYIQSVVDARTKANKAKVQVEYLRMKFQENQSHEATLRQEMKMTT